MHYKKIKLTPHNYPESISFTLVPTAQYGLRAVKIKESGSVPLSEVPACL